MLYKILCAILLFGASNAAITDKRLETLKDSPMPRVFPCPLEEDIAPCVCTADDTTLSLDMDCSNVASDAELERIFAASMPFYDYNTLTITQNSNISIFTQNTFGLAYFKKVYITETTLRVIEDGVFALSEPTLEILDLSDNAIEIYPFETLPYYQVLTTLDLSGNKLKIVSNIEAPKLQTFDLSNNPDLVITQNLFGSCPKLVDFSANSCGLVSIGSGMFNDLPVIENINLAGNSIGFLVTDAIGSISHTIKSIDISNNEIATVEADFIQRFDPGLQVQMSGNMIIELTEERWTSLLAYVTNGSIHLDSNPLRCGCDIEWLYEETKFYQRFSANTACSDGYPIYDIPIDVFPIHC